MFQKLRVGNNSGDYQDH